MAATTLNIAKLRADLDKAAAAYKPRHVWTPEHDGVLRTYYGRVPASKLAATLGVSLPSIRNRALALGIKSRQ